MFSLTEVAGHILLSSFLLRDRNRVCGENERVTGGLRRVIRPANPELISQRGPIFSIIGALLTLMIL